MLNAKLLITHQFALVLINILVIRSPTVIPNHLHVRFKKASKFSIKFICQNFHLKFSAREPSRDDPCNPSPCGSNAQCSNGICTCIPEYQGDPYQACRPECVLNTDCSRDKACVRNKCIDPCPGTCGQNARCDVYNHIPMCSCPTGMTGNAFANCIPFQCMYFVHQHFNSSTNLFKYPNLSQHLSKLILVNLRLAVQTLNVVKITILQFAHAFLVTSGRLHHADLNV